MSFCLNSLREGTIYVAVKFIYLKKLGWIKIILNLPVSGGGIPPFYKKSNLDGVLYNNCFYYNRVIWCTCSCSWKNINKISYKYRIFTERNGKRWHLYISKRVLTAFSLQVKLIFYKYHFCFLLEQSKHRLLRVLLSTTKGID